MDIVFFSSVSENTRRFVDKLELSSDRVHRIPLYRSEDPLLALRPYILVLPTYGGGSRKGADVPPQVVRFLNDENNRRLLVGVVASGNTNFGSDYCLAGKIVAAKCNVPLYREIELLGMSDDVQFVKNLVEKKTHVTS